jgi:sulfofructose kinase
VKCILFFIKEFGGNAVDTTGAGDVFRAEFIYGLLRNWEATDILRFANAVAALKCRDFGRRKGISSLEEVRKFLDPA